MEQLIKNAEKIRSLEIQGATNVALSAIDFLSQYAKRLTDCCSAEEYLEKLREAKDILFDTRPTEPAMRNGLNYVINQLKSNKDKLLDQDILSFIDNCKDNYKSMIENSKNKIAQIGARRIPNLEENENFVVMTHCHSSVVTGIFLEAKKQGKDNFKVINTETQPRLQGHKTAKQLAKAGVEVIHVVDSAMRWAVNHFEVDLILIGADSITSEGTVLNKIGSRLLALVAHEEHVPFYVASPLLKYNPETSFGILEKIEMRDPNEIWTEAPKGITVLNPAFETVSRRYIDGLITEAGIFASSHVHFQFTKLYPELEV
ncbi:MAG: S-methyl-5-thioribose-1-phosphate isomerase [Candidatus Lokiarchaeota archaeon]|nr:S-methyl-5-thioribose-1-phosphate isomerase [Candidatus Lokiarchaeota archaeon]MBD3340562.1 S-methyl-5-thioribose-1-phosphate isomerase [Candidatus Lokiarchaeota archaeon]